MCAAWADSRNITIAAISSGEVILFSRGSLDRADRSFCSGSGNAPSLLWFLGRRALAKELSPACWLTFCGFAMARHRACWSSISEDRETSQCTAISNSLAYKIIYLVIKHSNCILVQVSACQVVFICMPNGFSWGCEGNLCLAALGQPRKTSRRNES